MIVVKAGDLVKANEVFRKNEKKSSFIYVAMLDGIDEIILIVKQILVFHSFNQD